MPNYTISITDDDKKALEWDILSLQEWLDNAIHNKARQCIDSIVDIEIKRMQADPNITTMPTNKMDIFHQAEIESAADREKRLEQQLPE